VANGWDVARRARVSQSTVSRVLRGDERVAPQTRERVLRAAAQLGYSPDAAAQALITGRSGAVAVVVPDVSNPLYPELITAAQQELQEAGYRMLLLNARFGDAEAHVKTLRGRTVDGALLATSIIDSPIAAESVRQGLPTALVIRGVEGVAVDTFLADDPAGCALVADHLVSLGHTRIGMLTGPLNTTSGRDRERLFQASLRRHGLSVPPELITHGDYIFDVGAQAALHLLDRPDPPTALFCGSDILAFGALHAIREKGLRTPADVSVVGFDDVVMAGWDMISLTTVRQPIDRMARQAVRTLIARIAGDDIGEAARHVFEVSLVERKTTGPAPGLSRSSSKSRRTA
jgi:LacI family transcriptional regulator